MFCLNDKDNSSISRQGTNSVRCMHPDQQRKETVMNVFDRQAKRMQKNRAAVASDAEVYDYIKDEVRLE